MDGVMWGEDTHNGSIGALIGCLWRPEMQALLVKGKERKLLRFNVQFNR